MSDAVQVSDYLEFGKEDSPEEKAAALESVVSVGEHVWVKRVHLLGSLSPWLSAPGCDEFPLHCIN